MRRSPAVLLAATLLTATTAAGDTGPVGPLRVGPVPAAGQAGGITGRVLAPGGPGGDLVVYLVPRDTERAPTPADTTRAVIDQRSLRFSPSLLVVQEGAEVAFLNSDPLLHNVFSPPGLGAGFDLGTYPRTESRTHRFDESGSFVVLCHVHPEMVARVVVVPSRHFALTEPDGSFRMDGVPEGRYTLVVWQDRGPPVEREVVVEVGRVRHVSIRLDASLDGSP